MFASLTLGRSSSANTTDARTDPADLYSSAAAHRTHVSKSVRNALATQSLSWMTPLSPANPSAPRSRQPKLERSRTMPEIGIFRAPASSTGDTPTQDKKAPRPPNAWILYRSDTIKRLREEKKLGKRPQAEISRLISYLWRDETPEVRKRYEDEASRRKREHAAEFPEYRYKPRRKRTATVSGGSEREPSRDPATRGSTGQYPTQTYWSTANPDSLAPTLPGQTSPSKIKRPFDTAGQVWVEGAPSSGRTAYTPYLVPQSSSQSSSMANPGPGLRVNIPAPAPETQSVLDSPYSEYATSASTSACSLEGFSWTPWDSTARFEPQGDEQHRRTSWEQTMQVRSRRRARLNSAPVSHNTTPSDSPRPDTADSFATSGSSTAENDSPARASSQRPGERVNDMYSLPAHDDVGAQLQTFASSDERIEQYMQRRVNENEKEWEESQARHEALRGGDDQQQQAPVSSLAAMVEEYARLMEVNDEKDHETKQA